MKAYEGLFVFPPDSTPDVRKNQLKNLDDLIAKTKGQVTQKTEWGKKLMGYPIRKHAEGHVLIYDFQMDPANTVEFRRGLDLQEDLIKYMVTIKEVEKVRAEKKPKAPAAPAAAPSASKPAPKSPQTHAAQA